MSINFPHCDVLYVQSGNLILMVRINTLDPHVRRVKVLSPKCVPDGDRGDAGFPSWAVPALCG